MVSYFLRLLYRPWYILQARLYRKKAMQSLSYRVRVSTDEAIEGDDIYIYEEITNGKALPLPLVRVDLSLPEGLEFRMMGNTDLSGRSDRFRQTVGSSFVLRGNQTVERRRRVYCRTRGVYEITSALMVTGDLLGSETLSGNIRIPRNRKSTLTVLPKIHPLSAEFTASLLSLGEETAAFSLFTDPLCIAGTRDYTPLDPMKSINWKSTAAHGRAHGERRRVHHASPLFSPAEYADETDRAGSRRSRRPGTFGGGDFGLRVDPRQGCGAGRPGADHRQHPPESVGGEPLSEEGEERKILLTAPCKGKGAVLDTLRLLAALKMEISLPIDRLLDRILADPAPYALEGGIVFVSGYLSERMVIFYEEMKKAGVGVIFFITGRRGGAALVPEDMPVYYA